MIEMFLEDSRETPETIDMARELLFTTRRQTETIDGMLARHARHWGLDRLALVDRNILRLATAELLNRSAPYKVVIAESLRLAQEFSTLESPRFVNGVLDAVAKDLMASRESEEGADGQAPGEQEQA
jgi:N utilization substance protein B